MVNKLLVAISVVLLLGGCEKSLTGYEQEQLKYKVQKQEELKVELYKDCLRSTIQIVHKMQLEVYKNCNIVVPVLDTDMSNAIAACDTSAHNMSR